jgi:hypothetical protein
MDGRSSRISRLLEDQPFTVLICPLIAAFVVWFFAGRSAHAWSLPAGLGVSAVFVLAQLADFKRLRRRAAKRAAGGRASP